MIRRSIAPWLSAALMGLAACGGEDAPRDPALAESELTANGLSTVLSCSFD